MLTTILLLLAAQSAVQPARTVNGQELGTAEEFATRGPATVCMRELVIRPRAGQAVQLGYSGIHSGTLRVILENGAYGDFTDGEIFIDQRKRATGPVATRPGMEIFLIHDQRPKVEYQLEGTRPQTDDYSPPRVLVSGPGLASDRTDDRLFDEVSFADPESVTCNRRYQYGWGVLLEGEPFDVQNDAAGDEGRTDQ